jgi:hypothetical protein
MSYTIKPSLASARDRAINLLQIVWHFPGGVPSPGGTSPNRKTGLAGLDNREESDASRMCSVMVMRTTITVQYDEQQEKTNDVINDQP